MPVVYELTHRCFSVGVADGGWHGAYDGWSNKPPPLARKMPSRLLKYRWISLASKEGALSKKLASGWFNLKIPVLVVLDYWSQATLNSILISGHSSFFILYKWHWEHLIVFYMGQPVSQSVCQYSSQPLKSYDNIVMNFWLSSAGIIIALLLLLLSPLSTFPGVSIFSFAESVNFCFRSWWIGKKKKRKREEKARNKDWENVV